MASVWFRYGKLGKDQYFTTPQLLPPRTHDLLGMPRHIVSPLVIEIVIQKHRREETKVKGSPGFEMLDDLPRA